MRSKRKALLLLLLAALLGGSCAVGVFTPRPVLDTAAVQSWCFHRDPQQCALQHFSHPDGDQTVVEYRAPAHQHCKQLGIPEGYVFVYTTQSGSIFDGMGKYTLVVCDYYDVRFSKATLWQYIRYKGAHLYWNYIYRFLSILRKR